MEATHRVKDSNNKTIGFIIERAFFTDYFVAQNIGLIDNLSITKNGVIRSKKELPVIDYKNVTKSLYAEIVKQNPYVRDIQNELTNWKKNNNDHKVLQIHGPRQVGKTTEILKFAYSNYEYVIYVNLADDKFKFTNLVINQGAHILAMEAYCRNANLPHFLNSRNTILIIDEIQISPVVYNSIRTINSTFNCDLIVAGSYLGQTLRKEYFQPAGTVEYIKMFTLSFSEFCRIFTEDKTLKNIDIFGNDTVDNYNKLDKLYKIYRKIGGYPEVIKEFLQTGDTTLALSKISKLLATFEQESRNYFTSTKDALIFSTAYREVFNEMCNERRGSGKDLVDTITKLSKQSLKTQISKDEVSNAIQWLKYSGILGDCDLYVDGDIRKKLPSRRLYFMDCGLANYIASTTNNNDTVVAGILSETFVYSELYRVCSINYANRKVKETTPCFSTHGAYELDFMLVGVDNTIYGIEVKTTTGEPTSLKVYRDKKTIAEQTIGWHRNKFDTIPVYVVGARFPYK